MSKKLIKTKAIEGEVTTRRKPKKPTKAVIKQEVAVVAGLQINTGDLKGLLAAQTEQRQLVKDFVSKHLVKGVDYIRIHVVRDCSTEEQRRGSCKNMKHFSKDILAKPGQEKIFSLFQLTSELVKDTETIEMLAGQRGLVAYKCVVKSGDKIIAEGRGAGVVGENKRDVNATIKIAEKRARMDACLSLGFSEYFAQDLDDPDYQTQRQAAEMQAAAQADDGTGLAPRDPESDMDSLERNALAKLMLGLGFNTPEEQLEILARNGIKNSKKIKSGEARNLIRALKNNAFEAPSTTNTVLDDASDTGDLTGPTVALAEDPELDVDEDFKAEVQSRAEDIGLNANGTIWLMKKISGRPFAKWPDLKDEDWRRAYDVVMSILNLEIEVPKHYFDKNPATKQQELV